MSTDPQKKPDTDPAEEPTATKPEHQEPPVPPTPQPQPQSEPVEPDDDSEPERDPDPEHDPDPEPDLVAEVTALRHELQAANAKLAAYKAGVPSAAVDDAVVLALHDLQKSGTEITPEALDSAMTSVLQRHPDWLRAKNPPAPAKAGAPQKEQKPTDKSLPSGTVIF